MPARKKTSVPTDLVPGLKTPRVESDMGDRCLIPSMKTWMAGTRPAMGMCRGLVRAASDQRRSLPIVIPGLDPRLSGSVNSVARWCLQTTMDTPWPGLTRPPTSFLATLRRSEDVDGRVKPGHGGNFGGELGANGASTEHEKLNRQRWA